MGTAELWTTDNSLYKFTQSTSLDSSEGEIIREHAELRRRIIHTRHTAPRQSSSSNMLTSPRPENDVKIDYNLMRPKPIDTSEPSTYTRQLYNAFMIANLCNNSSIRRDEETGELKTVGDPTEIALTVASQKAGLGRPYWDELKFQKVFERAFDSERKLMSSVFMQGDKLTMVCKGAPEELLQKCTHFMTSESMEEMNDDFASEVYDENVRMASQGLRVLGLAYKLIPTMEDPHLNESDLVFVGLVGLIDPPKQGVKEAVETCQQAGIHVMMITGDHVETATAIASQLGIFNKKDPRMVKIKTHGMCLY
jgi:Ca2+-transporting ATPase